MPGRRHGRTQSYTSLPPLCSTALAGREIALDRAMIECLRDRQRVGDHLHTFWIAKMLQAASTIEVYEDWAGDAKAGIDIVTSLVGGWDSVFFFIPGEVVPEEVEGNRMLEIHVVRGDPLEGVETPVHEIAHIGPPINGVDGHADEVVVVACD